MFCIIFLLVIFQWKKITRSEKREEEEKPVERGHLVLTGTPNGSKHTWLRPKYTIFLHYYIFFICLTGVWVIHLIMSDPGKFFLPNSIEQPPQNIFSHELHFLDGLLTQISFLQQEVYFSYRNFTCDFLKTNFRRNSYKDFLWGLKWTKH